MFKKKTLTLLVSLALLICVGAGSTLAFLSAKSGPIDNLFDPTKVTTTITEDVNGPRKENVFLTNTGTTEAYIRAAVVVSWKNEQGEVYGTAPKLNEDYTVTWGTGWTPEGGYYYYNKPVEAGGSTTNLIESIGPATGKNAYITVETADGEVKYFLNVEILGSGIQSQPTSVVQKVWGLVPG